MSRPADARRATPPGARPSGPPGADGPPAPTPGPTTPVAGIPVPSPSPERPSSPPAGGSAGVPTRGRAAGGPDAGGTRIPPPNASGGGLPPYTPARRFADWHRARADGRAGLPGLEPGRPPGTPTLEELAQDFLARSHRERLRLDVELAPLLESEAGLVARIEQHELAAGRAEERLAGWPVLLADDQLALRRGGEARTADDVVRSRRAREYDAMRRPLVEEIERLRRSTAAAHEELARVRAAVRAREIVGATRVRRLHAQAMRRISAYERHLVRHHPAGDRVGPVLAAQHPRIPGWVFAAEDPAVPPGEAATPPAGFTTAGPRPTPTAPDPSSGHPAGRTGRHATPAEEA
jgi:hypothetical protein